MVIYKGRNQCEVFAFTAYGIRTMKVRLWQKSVYASTQVGVLPGSAGASPDITTTASITATTVTAATMLTAVHWSLSGP